MNNKDDIVGRLHVVKGSLQNRGFGGLSGEYESVVLAISRIQSDAKRIAELEAEVKRLQDDLHAEKGFTEILMSEREPTP